MMDLCGIDDTLAAVDAIDCPGGRTLKVPMGRRRRMLRWLAAD